MLSVSDIVDDITGNLINDGSANYIQLIEGVQTVGDITSIILGVLLVLIVVGLPIVIAIEICYINFPLVRDSFERLVLKTSGHLNTVLGLVIRDAKRAVVLSDTVVT